MRIADWAAGGFFIAKTLSGFGDWSEYEKGWPG